MRPLYAVAFISALAGCAPMRTQGDANVAALYLPQSQLCANAYGSSAGSLDRNAAHKRISEAKIDCTPYIGAIAASEQARAAQQARDLQLLQLGTQMMTTPPAAAAPPVRTNCYSRTIGNQVYTSCQ